MNIYELQHFSTRDCRLLSCLDIPPHIEQNYPQSITEGITLLYTRLYTLTPLLDSLQQAIPSEERVDIPSPVRTECVLIVDTVHVFQAGWHRVGQVDSETSPPGEHTNGLQGKLTLKMLSFDPLSYGADCSLLMVFLAGGREEIYL